MFEFILDWATKEKFFSRYLLFVFLILTLLSGPDNIKSMVYVLEDTEVIGFIFDKSFIKIFVWMIAIVILIEIYLTLRGKTNISSSLMALQSEVSDTGSSDEKDLKEWIRKFKKADAKVQDKVVKLLHILILTILEGIFMMILNHFNSATLYIGSILILLVILFIVFTCVFFTPLNQIRLINKEAKKWEISINRNEQEKENKDEQLDEKDRQIEKLQNLLDQQQQLTLQTSQQIQHLQLKEAKELENEVNTFEKKLKKGFFNRWCGP